MRPVADFVEVVPGHIVAASQIHRIELDEECIRYTLLDGTAEEFGLGSIQGARMWYECVRASLGAFVGHEP